MSAHIWVGIDPGVTGAIAAISPSGPPFLATPPSFKVAKSTKTKKGNTSYRSVMDAAGMARLVMQIQDVVAGLSAPGEPCGLTIALEDVRSRPTDGAISAFHFGEGKGIWEGIIATLALVGQTDIRSILVSPSEWRPEMVGRKTDKAMSLVIANRLFPKAQFAKDKELAGGQAEALLIAEYVRRRTSGAREANHGTPTRGRSKR